MRLNGVTERIATLDSLGDANLDAFLRDTVAGWRFTGHAPLPAPVCLVRTFVVHRGSQHSTGLQVTRHGAGPHGGMTLLDAAP